MLASQGRRTQLSLGLEIWNVHSPRGSRSSHSGPLYGLKLPLRDTLGHHSPIS